MNSLFSEGTLYRVIHANDIVPHLPLEIESYIHAGIEVWYP
jgi:hypothetical protein